MGGADQETAGEWPGSSQALPECKTFVYMLFSRERRDSQGRFRKAKLRRDHFRGYKSVFVDCAPFLLVDLFMTNKWILKCLFCSDEIDIHWASII